MLTHLIIVASFFCLFIFIALTWNMTWIFVGIIIFSAIVFAVVGYFYGILALARSRDAFGHSGYAFLALIPIANFVLLLKDSRKFFSPNRIPTINLLSGKEGVVSGLVIAFVSIALLGFFGRQSENILANMQNNPKAQSATIEYMVRTQGLEETIKAIVRASQTPVVVDEVTTLKKVESEGSRMRRTYAVDLEDVSLSRSFWYGIEKQICSYVPFSLLLREGAAIEDVYVELDGSLIGAHLVTQESCGN